MKKFWNLMLAALVIIGATACTENYENIENAESFSFYAEIGDDTRATIEKDGDVWKTTFEGNETLMVNGYKFTNTKEEPGKFTCTEVGVSKLAGAEVTITTDGTHHSLQGKAAFNANATVENFGAETVKLTSPTSFFRYTYNGKGEVKLTLTEAAFRTAEGTDTTEITISGTGEQFVAFWPQGDNATLTYYVNNVECKSASKAFAAGMVYNLGELKSIYELSTCTVNGAHNNWDAETATPMYIVGDFQVAYNVAVTEFKLLTTAGDWLGVASSNIALSTWVPASTSGNANIKVSAGNYDIYYSIDRQLICVVTAGAKVPSLPELPQTRTIYLNTGGSSLWNQGGAWFEAWVWGGSTADAWYKFVAVSGKAGYYYIEVPKDRTGLKILRKSSSHAAGSWNYWNEVGDIAMSSTHNMVTITGWQSNSFKWETFK